MSNTALVNNIYFTCENYNSGLANIPAEQDTNLLYPLIPNGESQNYQLAVAKCRIPLGSIPLTTQNLDLKKYQLTLRNGSNEASAYVKQIDALTGSYYYILDGNTIKRYSYTSTSTTLTKTINLTNICSFVLQFVVDDYENIYIAGSTTSAEVANELIIVDSNQTPTIIYQEEFTNIKSIYIDRSSNFYLMDEDDQAVGVLCYNNQIGLNSVSLSLNFTITKNFADNNLTNGICVSATENNIIVAHDLNVLTYYTSTGIAITDYVVTGADQLVASNVLASEDILMTADINQLVDQLIGTSNDIPYDIETNTALTNGQIISQLAVASNVGYVIGINQHLYSVSWPITSPPANYTEINTTTNLKAICTRINTLTGISTTDDLYFYNLNTPYGAIPSNEWGLTVVNFKPSSHGVISYDWNVSNNKMLVVDSQNSLSLSNTGIYPLGMMITKDTTELEMYGYENYGNSSNVMKQHLLSSNSYNSENFSNYAVRNGIIYAVQGNIGSQKVYSYQISDLVPTGQVFNCVECGGTIRSITMVDNNIAVVGDNYNVAIYSIITTSLINNITQYIGDNSVQVTGFQDSNHIIILSQIFSLNVWIYTGTPALLTTYNVPGSTVYDITINPNDQTGSNPGKVFVSYYSNTDVYSIDAIVFDQNFVFVSTANIAFNLNTPFDYIFCNVDNGMLICVQSSLGTATIYYQSSNYFNNAVNIIQNIPTDLTYIYFPQSFTGYYTFTPIICNITPVSIAISRTNTNTVYAIDSADNKLYQGFLTNNSITFTQMPQFQNTYSYISTAKNTNTNINSTLRTYTISNQTPIANVVLTNNKIEAIAKNETSGQFLVGLYSTNQIRAYNSSLVAQYTLSQTNPYSLFAKPADDINVPNVSIYNLQVVVDNINAAFLEAWNKLNALGGTLAEAPSFTLDYTGFLTLNYSADYTQTGNAILFNNPLINLCYFQNVPDSQDVGFYRLVLKPSSTSTTQLAKSMYLFNQLDKILIQSTSLFVAGSWYGNNSISQVLTDIDVPIDSATFAIGNIGQVLYYQPAMLRVFQMASGGNAVNRIQMSILFRYRNGTQYTLQHQPGEAFSVKLEFIKRF